MSSTHLLVLLTVVLAVGVVIVLAVALIEVRKRLERISTGLESLSGALQGVEAEHLRPLEPAVKAINAQFDIILGALPGIAGKAKMVAEKEAAMILWWLGDVILLFVVLPVVIYLLRATLRAVRSIPKTVEGIASVAAAGSRDLNAVPLLLTTQDSVIKTVAGVADYGGSLDVILDDAQ